MNNSQRQTPPNYRQGDYAINCGNCVHFDGVTHMCGLYNLRVVSTSVCDSLETHGDRQNGKNATHS